MGSEWILGDMDWIRLAQDRDRWRAVVSAVMNLRVLAPLVRETFNNAYPVKEEDITSTGNKISVHRKCFNCYKCSSSDRTAETTAVQISNTACDATTGYGFKNSILLLVFSFCALSSLLRR
jgi:hypothetical protein